MSFPVAGSGSALNQQLLAVHAKRSRTTAALRINHIKSDEFTFIQVPIWYCRSLDFVLIARAVGYRHPTSLGERREPVTLIMSTHVEGNPGVGHGGNITLLASTADHSFLQPLSFFVSWQGVLTLAYK